MARLAIAGALACVLLLGLGVVAPAEQVQVIKVSMDSFRFTPSVLTFNAGQRVVVQLNNVDPKPDYAHTFASQYLSTVDYTVTGQAKQGVTKDGVKYVLVEPGKSAEISFVPAGRGQWSFYCSAYNHASKGQTGALVVWPPGYRPATP
jgi:uncharacterized cupredoxin-like copper-binding protein